MGLFNEFPYTDLNGLNLDYTLTKLNSLIADGRTLFSQLEAWKNNTDAQNDQFRTNLVASIQQWETTLTTSLEVWKNSVDQSVIDQLTAAKAELLAYAQTVLAGAETAADNAATSAAAANAALIGASAALDDVIIYSTGKTREGEDVPSTSPAYQNNAKYYFEQTRETAISTLIYKWRSSWDSRLLIRDAASSNVDKLEVTFTPVITGNGNGTPSNPYTLSGRTSLTAQVGADSDHLTDYTISFDNNNVYAGIVDMISGSLTKEYEVYTITGNETIATSNADNHQYYLQLPSASPAPVAGSTLGRNSSGWCSHYTVNRGSTQNAQPDLTVLYANTSFSSNVKRFFFRDNTRFNSVQDVRDFFTEQYNNGTPVVLVYKLATPVTYDLTGITIPFNTGTNLTVISNTQFRIYYHVQMELYELGITDYVTPQMFGAVADGIADDTAAFQAAVNSGMDVHVPTANKEIYRITNTINIPTHCKQIFGDGMFEGINTRGIILFDLSYKTGSEDSLKVLPLFSVGDTQAVHISNLKFVSKSLGNHEYGVLINAASTLADKDIILYNIGANDFYRITTFRGRGFELMNSWIASCEQIGSFNWADENESNVNHDPATGQRALSFKNNRFHNITGTMIDIYSGHAYGLTFENNLIDNGSFGSGSGWIFRSKDEAWNWLISGNVFQGIVNSGNHEKVLFESGMQDCIISNNIFCYDTGYWVGDTTPPHSYIYSTGEIKNSAIIGNTFKNCRSSAIDITTATGSVFNDNVIYNAGQTTSGAIRIQNVCNCVSIVGNSIVSTDNTDICFYCNDACRLNYSKVIGNSHSIDNSGFALSASRSTGLITDESTT